ncbi:Ionotropic glutamate receptor [Trinorchestia longiramus]|nr:Ionotropic glutamate receptor [Trinorchestia longiramus]
MGYTVPNSPTGESFEVLEPTPGCITVAITPWSPPIADYSKRPYSGSHVELFFIFMRHLGWCYYLVHPPDNSLGVLVNGSFTGAVGMIERKEADIVMGPLAQSLFRSSVLDYGYGYIYGDCSLLYKRITSVKPDVFTLIKPFHMEVWLILAVAVMVVGVAAVLFNRFHFVLRREDTAPAAGDQSSTGSDVGSKSFLWTWKIFVAQDLADSPRGHSGHVLTIFWLVISFMIASMYRCNLKAILINDKVRPPFSNAEEFVKQNKYTLTWIDGKIFGPYLLAHSIESPNETHGQMWAKRTDLILSDHVISTVLSKKVAVLEPTLALISLMAEDFSKAGMCRLALSDSGVTPTFMALGFPRQSTLREHVDRVLLRLVQAGIPQHLQAYNMRNASWCLKPTTTSESRPIAVEDLLGIFAIHGIGLIFGVMAFLLELAVHRSTSKSRRTAADHRALSSSST